MNPWIETLAVLGLACLGAWLGVWFSRLPKSYWTIGYLIPLALIFVYGVAIRNPWLAFHPPVSWMMAGRNKFTVIAFVATMVLVTPLSRLPAKRVRALVCVFTVLMVWHLSLWPFLAPAFNRKHLSQLQTTVDRLGICRQSNDYNCGPASAVTALRKLGFPAEEGEIAILAHTSSATGTPPDILARSLQEKYGADGLVAEYRLFKDVSELKDKIPTLAVIKYSFMLDHYVTVLEVTEEQVIVGDPLSGREIYSRDEFAAKWRFEGIVLRRQSVRL